MSMPEYAMTYIAYWPEHEVLKVGRAWKWSRIDLLTRSGAVIVSVARGTPANWERYALEELAYSFPKAFERWEDAFGILWRGRGWTECFHVPEALLNLALEAVIAGYARGDEPIEVVETGGLDEPVTIEGVDVGADDGPGSASVCGRSRAGGSTSGVDQGGALPGGRVGDDESRGGASAGTRRRRLLAPVHVGGSGSVAAPASDAGGSADEVTHPGAASGTLARIRGCGEWAGVAGASRGVGGVGRVGSRAGAWRRTAGQAALAGCSADRLSRSSERKVRRLRALRYGSPPAFRVAGYSALFAAGRRLREIKEGG